MKPTSVSRVPKPSYMYGLLKALPFPACLNLRLFLVLHSEPYFVESTARVSSTKTVSKIIRRNNPRTTSPIICRHNAIARYVNIIYRVRQKKSNPMPYFGWYLNNEFEFL